MAEQGAGGATNEDEMGKDTDEQFADHPEEAPDESRISVEKIKNLEDVSMRRLADTGDIVEEDGTAPQGELRFDRNDDFAGNEGNVDTYPDYGRGSGFIGGKLIGEPESSTENISEPSSPKGFGISAEQQKNIEAAFEDVSIEEPEAKDENPPMGKREKEQASWKSVDPHPVTGGDLRDQGRDIGRREQATGSQRFGRDVGASGLPILGEGFESADLEHHDASSREHAEWSRVLSRLGGSSPGSSENLQLAEKFGRVQFPAGPDDVLRKLEPGADLRIKEGVSIDLRQAVLDSHMVLFRSMNELIDCVKDALRRAESLERHPA